MQNFAKSADLQQKYLHFCKVFCGVFEKTIKKVTKSAWHAILFVLLCQRNQATRLFTWHSS